MIDAILKKVIKEHIPYKFKIQYLNKDFIQLIFYVKIFKNKKEIRFKFMIYKKKLSSIDAMNNISYKLERQIYCKKEAIKNYTKKHYGGKDCRKSN